MNSLSRLYHTLSYLKPRQLLYRGYYLTRRKLGNVSLKLHTACGSKGFVLIVVKPVLRHSTLSKSCFTFLNRSHDFSSDINWNYSDQGRLWAYNLNYFDFLNQENCLMEEGLGLIRNYLAELQRRDVGLEPYPTSLRIMNWVKFLAAHQIRDEEIDSALYLQALHLMDNLEYHLLGNHLLENGFALLFAAALFPEGPFARKAEEIVVAELEEQILFDGAHFELSPMYHQIILDRLLDCINILQSNNALTHLLPLLRDKGSLMLGWLRQMATSNGEIPLLNDSAFGIAPTAPQLFSYAERLGVPTSLRPLGASGYRKIGKAGYELVADVGNIGPDYIPGHAHSDTFNFVLHVQGKPVIVDTGTSTYDVCERRLVERGTAAHNTVQLDGLEQSEVWGSFRVARRAYVRDLVEERDEISAWHDGYCRIGARHARKFHFSDHGLQINDTVISKKKYTAVARIHFHPDIEVALEGDAVVAGPVRVTFTGSDSVTLNDYQYAPQFNTLLPAKVVEIGFGSSLITNISIGSPS